MLTKKTIFKFLTYMIVGLYFSFSTNYTQTGTNKTDTTQKDTFNTIKEIENPKIDSLLNILKSAKHDTTKIKTFNTIAWELKRNNPKQALKYAKQALELCDKRVRLRATAYHHIGEIYRLLGNYPLAFENNFNALKIYETLNDITGKVKSYNNIGNIYVHKGEYILALSYYFKALKIKEKIKLEHPDDRSNQKSLAYTYSNVGNIYLLRDEYKLALKYYFEAMDNFKKLNNKNEMGVIYNNIAAVYSDQGKLENSLKFHLKSLAIDQEFGDRRRIATSYSNIGATYAKLANADTTADIQKKFEQALKYHHKALKMKKELGDIYSIINTLLGIGDIYIMQGKIKESLPLFKQGAVIAEEIGAKAEMRDAYFGLYKAYKKLYNLSQALTYHEKYDIVKDSVHNEEISKAIGKLEGVHEIDIKNIKQVFKQKEKERIAAEEKKRSDTQQHLGITSVLFSLIILIFFFTFRKLATLIPFKVVEIILFITFLLFFEYMLMLLDPIIEELSGGLPALRLALTSIVAGVIFPFHRFFENKIKQRIYKAKKEKAEKRHVIAGG